MRITWKYEGRIYEVYRRDNGNWYINHVQLHSDIDAILQGLNSENEEEVEKAKRFAEKLFESGDKEIVEWTHKRYKKINRRASINSFIESMPLSLALVLLALSLIVGVIYIIYQVWWFFIGDSAFNGPFADDISAGDVVFRTIVFFIALIVIIEEVIRRIRNGHF